MRKVCILFFIFCSMDSYAQTWTEYVWGDEFIGITVDTFTVITMEQFNRLIEQHKTTNKYCLMKYTDALKIGSGRRVMSGVRPRFNGYYFLLIQKGNRRPSSSNTVLVYGNSNTGRMELEFGPAGGVSVGSQDYIRRWNQFVSWVKGE